MTQIQRGENVFAAMRIILPEHRALMIEREAGSGGKSGADEPTDAQYGHPLDEFARQEAEELLAAAHEEGFPATLCAVLQKGAPARTWTGTVEKLDSREQRVYLRVEGRTIPIPVAGLMQVERERE